MRFLIFLTFIATSASAQIGPDFMKPTTNVPADYKDKGAAIWRESRPLDDAPKGAWWKIYKDKKLNSLIEQATEENQQLKAAVARFDQARASARIARGNFFPSVSGTPVITHQGTSANMPSAFDLGGLRYKDFSYDVPLDFSYEVDLWGKVRREVESSRAGAAAAFVSIHQIHLGIQADVATNYFRIRSLDREMAIVREAVVLRKEAYDIAAARVEAGAGSNLEQEQAATEVATAEAEISALQIQRDQLENAIAILIGANAAGFKLEPNPLGVGVSPPSVPSGTPSDLLERRPDVAQAERLLAASCSRIGVAKAAFFPSVRLIGNGGYLSGDLTNLFEEASQKWILGPSINIPLFSGGKNHGSIQRVRAEYDENLAMYRQSILGAFAEVENSLSALRNLATQQEALNRAHQSARKAAEIAKTRYETGASAYLEVIEANRTLLITERSSAQVNGQRHIASISLIKALGGGWEQAAPPAIPQTTPDPEAKSVTEEKRFFEKVGSLFKKKEKEEREEK
ncbi:MAG: efflux transporter outer membrane subunit [Verrucomicrobiae bacterium]|nr:efflux transporter outer membrane subunit [Verrucomicrobiae bacterium]